MKPRSFYPRCAFFEVCVSLPVPLGLALAKAEVASSKKTVPGTTLPYSTLRGNTVRLEPAQFAFVVPRQWLDWNSASHGSFFLTHSEIDKSKNGRGEWVEQYAAVANSILPIEQCAAHVGYGGWMDSVGAGVHIRAYLSPDSPTSIQKRVAKQGVMTAAKLKFAESKEVIVEQSRRGH